MASLANRFERRRFIFANGALIGHQAHMVAGDRYHVRYRFADAMLAQHAVEHFRRSAAPIVHVCKPVFSNAALRASAVKVSHGSV